jgi:hypothetical protein
MKRFFIVFVFLVTIGVGIAAVYLSGNLNSGDVSPLTSKAATPINCQLDVTQNNPKADINIGTDGNGPYPIPQYCPGETGKMLVTKSGKLVVYLSRPDLTIKVNGESYTNALGVVTTNKVVNQGDYIVVAIGVGDKMGIGWTSPTVDDCGDPVWGTVSIKSLSDKVTATGNTIMERMCWGDAPLGRSDFDFNNFQAIVAIEGVNFEPTMPTIQLTPTTKINASTTVKASITPTLELFETLKPTTGITATSPLNVILSGTPKVTSIIESQNAKLSCGPTNTCMVDDDCQIGNICAEIDSVRRCTAQICLTDGVANNICETDLCTPKNEIIVNKEVVVNCVAGQDKKQLNYKVVLTNPGTNTEDRKNLNVVDTLDASMKSEYLIKTSIPFKGVYDNGKIEWTDLMLTASNGRLELNYTAIVSPEEYGKEYVNQLTVYEDNILRGSKTIIHKIEVLPCTALISDRYDYIILGVLTVMVGLLMYKLGVDRGIGSLLWRSIGKNTILNLSPKNVKKSLLKEDKNDFEKKISKKFVND